MKMLSQMFAFELRYFVRQPSFLITLAMFALMPFLMMSLNRINITGANSLKNSDFSIAMMMSFFSAFALFLVINFVANTAIRNSQSGMEELLCCKPITPLSYQLGRFLGAWFTVLCVFTMVPLGLFIGTLMPWVDPELIGKNQLGSYLRAFIYLSVPTLFVLACCFYALTTRLRSMMAANLLGIAVFIGFDLSEAAFTTPGLRQLAALLDPFGLNLLSEIGRYWTPLEKNTLGVEFNGVLLQNRALWLSIGVAILVLFGGLHRPLRLQASQRKKKNKDESLSIDNEGPSHLSRAAPHFRGQAAVWQPFLARTRLEIKQLLYTPSFLFLLIMTTTLILLMAMLPQGMFGTPIWPLTQSMVQVIGRALNIVMMIIITFYSSEVIWRERETGMGDIIDSLPVQNLSFWMSKLLALWSVIIILVAFSMCLTIGYQLARGYTDIEPGQYLLSLGLFYLAPWCLMAVLALLLQVLSRNKYMGMALFVLFILSSFAMEPLGLTHNLFRFSSSPPLVYSAMNGYGWLLTTQLWYLLYWGALTLAMGIVGYGMWHRGPVTSISQRFKLLPYQLGRAGGATLAAALLVFACAGSNIYYNTCVLNACQSTSEAYDLQAAYEAQYAQYADTPAPRITTVNAKVDIYPEKRTIKASAKVTVVNASSTPITRFLVNLPDHTSFGRITLAGAAGDDVLTMDKSDPKHSAPLQTYWMSLTKPMQPGEERTASIEVIRSHQGFKDKDFDVQLVRNGTFINNTELFPMFGYQSQRELLDRQQRRERGLPPPRRSNKLEDVTHYNETAMGHASGFIEFEATVSTIIGQTAIAPGYLQAHWTEAGRAYFHYKMDAPIGNYYAFLSARLDVVKADHNGVAIEVYHHPSHNMNVPRMITAIKDSLDYYTTNFGPYQHRQARIIEFPGYRAFAQSFANTIPFSETIGFFADLSDPDKLDSAYFVTAHEMAHQWWGGQVDGANVQGSTLLSESLAHYSALQVTQQRYGEAHSRRILNFELDRYLRERTEELIEELPWMRVENQPYIHYRKGVVTMNAVHQILGGERMNKALQAYLADYRFKAAPYPTTLDLKQRLEDGTNDAERQAIDDLFSRIILYDLKLMSAEAVENKDGSFELTIKIDAKRFEVDGQGQMTPLALDEIIEIGLSNLSPDEITTDKELPQRTDFQISTGQNIITLRSKTLPAFALIDPMVHFVDRDTQDNVRAIELITAD